MCCGGAFRSPAVRALADRARAIASRITRASPKPVAPITTPPRCPQAHGSPALRAGRASGGIEWADGRCPPMLLVARPTPRPRELSQPGHEQRESHHAGEQEEAFTQMRTYESSTPASTVLPESNMVNESGISHDRALVNRSMLAAISGRGIRKLLGAKSNQPERGGVARGGSSLEILQASTTGACSNIAE